MGGRALKIGADRSDQRGLGWVQGRMPTQVRTVQGVAMAELRVDSEDLNRSGAEIASIAAEVRASLANSDTEIASARSGWAGTSAEALASLAAEFQAATNTHSQDLEEHGTKFTGAAKRYAETDESGATSVHKAAEAISSGNDGFDLDVQFTRANLAPPAGAGVGGPTNDGICPMPVVTTPACTATCTTPACIPTANC